MLDATRQGARVTTPTDGDPVELSASRIWGLKFQRLIEPNCKSATASACVNPY